MIPRLVALAFFEMPACRADPGGLALLGAGALLLPAARHRGLSEPGGADDRDHHPADGWSAEEVERYVTIPLEIGLTGCSISTTSARSRCSASRT